MKKPTVLFALLPLVLTLSLSARAEAPKADGKSAESQERAVDEVALAAQSKSISTLEGLLKKYRGKRQEPTLLYKLAELQSQSSSILFRTAHGKAHRSNQALDLREFRRSTERTIATLDQLIARYPSTEEIASATFLRGHSYEELDKKDKATADYLALVRKFPDALEVPSAYMALAQFAIDANNHPLAIQYLSEVEKRPETPHFPFALYKLAWSHFNLKHVARAIEYGERQIAYYRARKLESSENALLENTLLDIPVFFIEGYETDPEAYSLEKAYTLFSKLEQNKVLGRMFARYAKLIRSHGHETLLTEWKTSLIAKESARPEVIEVVTTTFEFQSNRRRYAQLIASAQDFRTLYAKHKGHETFVKAQKMLLDTAETMRDLTLRNKNATEVSTLTKTLIALYDAFIQVVEPTDPRVARVHYNLAETLFALKDHDGATTHYRWIVENTPSDSASIAKVTDAALKAIASRYEVLREAKVIPTDVKPTSTAQDIEATKPMPESFTQWLAWLDVFKPTKDDAKQFENFAFEANRALYAGLHIHHALKRMTAFSEKNPSSHFAIPSASLVIDTRITSQDWEAAYETAENFLDVKEWRKPAYEDFQKKLRRIAADSYYKQIEIAHKGGDSNRVISMATRLAKRYPESPRVGDALVMKGAAEISVGDREDAHGTFTALVEKYPETQNTAEALLNRARLEEDAFRFKDAAKTYEHYFGLSADVRAQSSQVQTEIADRALRVAFLANDRARLEKLLGLGGLCEKIRSRCATFEGGLPLLTAETGVADAADVESAYARTKAASSETRAIWALVTLDRDLRATKKFPYQERVHLLKEVASAAKTLEPIFSLAFASKLFVTLPGALRLARESLSQVAPLKANQKSIKRRMEAIKELEQAAAGAMELPWARVRSELMNETATLYLDLAKDLAALPAPEVANDEEKAAYEATIRELVIPFEEKGQELRGRAFEHASNQLIELDSLHRIADVYFKENASLAKSLAPTGELVDQVKGRKPTALDTAFLAQVFPDFKWSRIAKYVDDAHDISLAKDEKELSLRLRALWNEAVQERNWSAAQYMMAELERKHLVDPNHALALKAVTLAALGARAEGFALLEEVRKGLSDASLKEIIVFKTLEVAVQNYSKPRIQALLTEFLADRVAGFGSDDRRLIGLMTSYASAEKAASTRVPASGK